MKREVRDWHKGWTPEQIESAEITVQSMMKSMSAQNVLSCINRHSKKYKCLYLFIFGDIVSK